MPISSRKYLNLAEGFYVQLKNYKKMPPPPKGLRYHNSHSNEKYILLYTMDIHCCSRSASKNESYCNGNPFLDLIFCDLKMVQVSYIYFWNNNTQLPYVGFHFSTHFKHCVSALISLSKKAYHYYWLSYPLLLFDIVCLHVWGFAPFLIGFWRC